MASIDQVVSVTITQETAAVSQPSFSVPLIMGPTNAGWDSDDYVHVYTAASEMLEDGFTTSSPEYLYALKLMSQNLTPTQFFVGKRASAVAQQDTFAVGTLADNTVYSFRINGTLISVNSGSSATQQSILVAFDDAISEAFTDPPVTFALAGTGVNALATLTAVNAGDIISYTAITSNLTHVETVAAVGIGTDIAHVSAQNDGWYGCVVCSATDLEILQAASYIESVKKIFLAASGTSAIGTSATTDVGSVLKASSYKRTALVFSPGAASTGIDAAWIGGQLPATPGSNNWAYKSLAGIASDALTATQINTCIGNPIAGTQGKNVNVYTTVGGVGVTRMGTMASGQYIDITIGIDWLVATLQVNVFSALINASKIPYTDKGVSILISAVRAAIDQGVQNGLIDGASDITITAPPVLSVPTNQRASRIAPTISFSCRLQGAVNAVVISGTVTV